MATTYPILRTEPAVVPVRHVTASARSRLPAALYVPILIVLNAGLRSALWSTASNFLAPELGAVSKVPSDADFWSLYSPGARILMNVATNCLNWYFNYDCKIYAKRFNRKMANLAVYDVAALTVLTNAPYAYLLVTYYEITFLTVFAHVLIEVLATAIPTYLLRPRSIMHRPSAPLRNRFLLNSVQVQVSSSLLAIVVYVCVLWIGLQTGFMNRFLVTHFDIPTLFFAYEETAVSLLAKVFIVGITAKSFLLNPSFAAQSLPGNVTPEEQFNPSTATLDQTIKANILPVEKRKRALAQQTIILNTMVFTSTVQRAMTLNGTELFGAAGYAGVWILANSILAVWYAWVGDTSLDYEPL